MSLPKEQSVEAAKNEQQLVSTGTTGIRLLSIFVDKIDYEFTLDESREGATLSTDVEILSQYQVDPPFGFVRLSIKCVSANSESRGHKLKARVIGSFRQIGDAPTVPFEKYLTLNAPATVYAFARELVYSVTSRSPIPPILLDPANMMALMRTSSLKFTMLPHDGNSE
jgi:preprotein translocase subunit SecB